MPAGGAHDNMRGWSPDEDRTLMRLVDENGQRWKAIAQLMGDANPRTAAMVRNRFLRILKGKQRAQSGLARNRCGQCGQIKAGHVCTARMLVSTSLEAQAVHHAEARVQRIEEAQAQQQQLVQVDEMVDEMAAELHTPLCHTPLCAPIAPAVLATLSAPMTAPERPPAAPLAPERPPAAPLALCAPPELTFCARAAFDDSATGYTPDGFASDAFTAAEGLVQCGLSPVVSPNGISPGSAITVATPLMTMTPLCTPDLAVALPF